MYTIYVRDKSLNRIAEVDNFSSLEVVLKFNDVGSWTMDVPYDVSVDKQLVKSNGIIVVRNGITLFSGPILNAQRKWDTNGDIMTLTGADDNVLLANRLAYPVVGTNDFTQSAYDVQTGIAETVMRHYVDANAGSSALSERQVQGLILASDQQRGSTVTGRARFDQLIVLLQSLALAGGDLGFRIVQTDANLQFEVYTPSDKTKTVIFSPLFGNLASIDYSESAAEANFIIAGGQGDLTARTFVESGDSASIEDYGRIEEFLDKRDTSDLDELNQAITEELSSKAQQTSLSISPIDTESIKFGRDYNLGDMVTVYIPGSNTSATIQDVVRVVTISLSSDKGEVFQPTIGTPSSLAQDVPKIFSTLSQLQNRVNGLERRI